MLVLIIGMGIIGAIIFLLRKHLKKLTQKIVDYSKLVFISSLPSSLQKEFGDKILSISKTLNINPNWLMSAIKFESAGTFSPSIQNKTTGATGLIQFMPSTAKGLGTTTDELKSMNHVKQLDFVERYFYPYRGKIKRALDLYLVIFFPIAVGKPDSFIIEAKNLSAEKIAKQNPVFDLNKDSKISVGEIDKIISKHFKT